jgi:hypothetical protein
MIAARQDIPHDPLAAEGVDSMPRDDQSSVARSGESATVRATCVNDLTSRQGYVR